MQQVLVVDDSRVVRRCVAAVLQEAGFSTVEAEDGCEAFDVFQQRAFDLVVTDIVMPNCDGLTLTGKIRAADREIPIVILTSTADRCQVDKAKAVGASAYLLKPFDPGALIQRVETLLASTSQTA